MKQLEQLFLDKFNFNITFCNHACFLQMTNRVKKQNSRLLCGTQGIVH